MTEIIRLKNSNEELIKKYIQKHYWELFYLSINIYNSGLEKDRWNKSSGDYYGFFGENQLKGLFSFANNKIMHVHYETHEILKKIDYFRALNRYKPKILKGTQAVLKETYQLIEHNVIDHQFNHYYIMALEDPIAVDLNLFEKVLTPNIINNSVEFLVNVEKTFGRNPKLINKLKERVNKKFKNNDYLFIEQDQRIIAQGSIERRNEHHCLISGIYTEKKFRNQGFGEKITLGLSKIIQERGLIPVLLVHQDNFNAIKLYKKIGFKKINKFSIMEIELR